LGEIGTVRVAVVSGLTLGVFF